MSRFQQVAALATLGVLALVVVLFFVLFERRLEEVETGLGQEARANPYLAVSRFLERLEVPTRLVRNPAWQEPSEWPAASAVVVLPSTALVDREAWARWRDWAEGGGLLIVGLSDQEARREFVATLGVRLVERDGSPETVVVGNLWDDEARFDLVLHPHTTLAPEAIDVAADGFPGDDHLPVARFDVGDGAIVILADDQILTNQRLGEAEHGRFFWGLATTALMPSQVVFVLQDHRPLFGQYLAMAWPLWMALGVWLCLFLWMNMARFGPLIEAPEPAQRGLREHLRAAARFLWRRREFELLIGAARRALARRAAAVLPGWADLSPAARAKALTAGAQRKVSVPPHRVDWALEGELPQDAETFLQQIDVLEKVRRSL